MTLEQRFAWMESMLDTTISCYEAHREALEKVYADLYRLHSEGNGCIHLSPEEGDRMLRGIANVLQRNALQLPAFEGDDSHQSGSRAPSSTQENPLAASSRQQRQQPPPTNPHDSVPRGKPASSKASAHSSVRAAPISANEGHAPGEDANYGSASDLAPNRQRRDTGVPSSVQADGTDNPSSGEGRPQPTVAHGPSAGAAPDHGSSRRSDGTATSSRASAPQRKPQQQQQQQPPRTNQRSEGPAETGSDSKNAAAHEARRAAPPADAPTAQHRSPSAGSLHEGSPSQRPPVGSERPSHAGTPTSQSLRPSQRSHEYPYRPNGGSGFPSHQSTPVAEAIQMQQHNRSAASASGDVNHSLADQYSSSSRRQPPASHGDPARHPHARSQDALSDSVSFPMRRSSASKDSSSLVAARNTGGKEKGSHPRSVQGSSHSPSAAASSRGAPPSNRQREEQQQQQQLYGHPDGMISSIAPHRQNGNGNGSEAQSATPGGGSTHHEIPEGGDRRHQEPQYVEYDPPAPKQLARHRPLRTAVPRRTSSNANDSHQVEELVYQRRSSPGRSAEPVLEDDPAVTAYLDDEDAALRERLSRERRAIASVPGCMTEAQAKRRRALLQSSAAPNPDSGALVATQGGAVTTTAAAAKAAKAKMTAAEEQLRKERSVLLNQLEKMQHEWAISMNKLMETGNEPRYRQLQTRMARVRKDLDRVDRELATVLNIEAKRAKGIAVHRSPSRA